LHKPLVLEYNGSEAWVAKNWGSALRSQTLAERCEEVALRHAHLVVTISDVLRDELLERGIPAERIVSYPNCIDPETFDPGRFSAADSSALRARYGIPPDALVVTFVGTFGQWHGAPVLAHAARILLEQRSEWVAAKKLHFLFVGDGVRMPEVKAALGQQVGSPYVTMTGLVPQREAPAYLAASDILSSPHIANADGSRFFGSPTKMFEYMAMGKAIIASDLEQIGEVLKGSVRVSMAPAPDELPNGRPPALLARPGSAEDIVAGLTFLAQRPDWRVFLGDNARALALKKYTWHNHVQAILERAQHLGLSI
jgi:glycosyltransferase involved in cell wall biosynthesis